MQTFSVFKITFSVFILLSAICIASPEFYFNYFGVLLNSSTLIGYTEIDGIKGLSNESEAVRIDDQLEQHVTFTLTVDDCTPWYVFD